MFVSLNNSGACGPATGIGSTYPTERGPSVASVSFERQPRWAPLDGLSENSVRHHPTQQPNAAAVRRRERRGCRATHEGEPSCRATSLQNRAGAADNSATQWVAGLWAIEVVALGSICRYGRAGHESKQMGS